MDEQHGPILSWFLKNAEFFLLLGLAMWGGTTSYIRGIEIKKQKFSARAWVGECTIAGFAGVMAMFLCQWMEMGPPASAIFSGIAGCMGSRWILYMEQLITDSRFTRKFPGKSEEDGAPRQ